MLKKLYIKTNSEKTLIPFVLSVKKIKSLFSIIYNCNSLLFTFLYLLSIHFLLKQVEFILKCLLFKRYINGIFKMTCFKV